MCPNLSSAPCIEENFFQRRLYNDEATSDVFLKCGRLVIRAHRYGTCINPFKICFHETLFLSVLRIGSESGSSCLQCLDVKTFFKTSKLSELRCKSPNFGFTSKISVLTEVRGLAPKFGQGGLFKKKIYYRHKFFFQVEKSG